MSFAEFIYSHLQLLLFDIVILFSLASARETLPWQAASQEVQQHMPNCLKIISS
jgi:hypothetical protein